MILIRKQWNSQPTQPVYLGVSGGVFGMRPEFLWNGASYSKSFDGFAEPWSISGAVLSRPTSLGQSAVFDGSTGSAITRQGGSTAAQTRFTFVCVAKATSFASYASLCALTGGSGINRGVYFGDTLGSGDSIGIIKGGVAALAHVAIEQGVDYVFVASHRQDTGACYVLARPLLGGSILRATQTNTASSMAGSGEYCIGRTRSDIASWNGPICMAFASFDWCPEIVGRQLLDNPWQLFAPRQIIIPYSAAGGYIPPTLLTASAINIGSAYATPRVTFSR